MLSIFLGICLSILIKIPLNYFAWLYFFGIPKESTDSLIFTVIVPFNIIKNLINCIRNIIKNNYYNEYLNKINDFFEIFDNNNCNIHYHEIING